MAAPIQQQCLCSHLQSEHTDGLDRCHEPTGRCQCQQYSELCSQCKHGQYSHNGINGVCTRVVQKTKLPCGCGQYPTEGS